MVYSGQASTERVVAAGLLRLAQLGARLVYLRANYQPTDAVVFSLIDLRQKLEMLGLTTDLGELNTLKGYVQETYGLLALYTDPLLRPALPPAPAVGATLRPQVLRVQGNKALFVQGNKVVALRYVLVPYPTAVPRLLRVQGGLVVRVQGGKVLQVHPGVQVPTPTPVVPSAPVTTTPVTTPATSLVAMSTTSFVQQTSVSVQHNLGRYANAVVYDSNNNEIEGSISSTLNSLTVSFSEPVSGTLYIS